MDMELNLEAKYQRLATEYSKVRSQATVLKKAVLDEQTKTAELHELLKKHEQTARKRDQEMESLNFRNEQLTKRIMVLQQELQNTVQGKKSKHKVTEIPPSIDSSLLNEELQKKILENAQLLNSVSDKDLEIIEYKERIKNLEDVLASSQIKLALKEKTIEEEREEFKTKRNELEKLVRELSHSSAQRKQSIDSCEENAKVWQTEAERWKKECTLLKSRPDSNDKLTKYYESQLSEVLESNVLLRSETDSAWAENLALKARLENLTLEHNQLKSSLKSSREELVTTNNNYKSQLDAMTEHLAAQNETITRQCDDIQYLKHKLSQKK
ncbi:uncharacterized protein [Leptinotarsa decemlineata]|uniref:uncharacterized protein n=1 Tax=Leptinotarsa decemlineata TaxID=7539 RepID=UPI003D305E68